MFQEDKEVKAEVFLINIRGMNNRQIINTDLKIIKRETDKMKQNKFQLITYKQEVK